MGDHGLIDLGVDFETYYASDYTLRKMTTAEYILDPRFEIIGVCLTLFGGLPVWFTGTKEEIRAVLSKLPWDRIRVIAHNAMFDGAILEWVLGFKPAKYLCSMMGVRPYVTPYTGRTDLGTVLKYLPELGVQKGNAVESFIGMRRADFTSIQMNEYGAYCKDDTRGCVAIAHWLKDKLPDDELELIDLTIKKFTRPSLCLDKSAIETRLAAIGVEKSRIVNALAKKNISERDVRSRAKLAGLLAGYGVAPPTKPSLATGEETYAFSKQDVGFLDLLGHANPDVSSLIEARFALASNMEETRLSRLLDLALLNFQGMAALPAPLLYYGAHTGRFSGLDKINLQNLPRSKVLADGKTPDPASGWLRKSIVAPPGWKIIAADLANIEARIVACLSGQWDMVTDFASGLDQYSKFATKVYGRPINKRDHPIERFVGKTCILGLGYGMGWAKFLRQMRIAKVSMDERMAKDIVYLYRREYSKIPELWGALDAILKHAVDPKCLQVFGPLNIMHERILLPNGMPIIYPGLRLAKTLGYNSGLVFRDRRSDEGELGLWGGAITENVVQALARIILTRAELRLARAGLKAVLQVHDELVFCVPDRHVDACMQASTLAMTAPVDFMPRLPVAVEIHSGQSYGDAK